MNSNQVQVDDFIRIKNNVMRHERVDNVVLVSRESGASVRVSPVAAEILPLLARGIYYTDLVKRMKLRYPNAANVSRKLTLFLQQLANSGLLETHGEHTVHRRSAYRLDLFNPDPVARRAAGGLLKVPRFLRLCLVAAAIAASIIGIFLLAYSDEVTGLVPHPKRLFDSFHAFAFLVFVFFVVPLHEAAHAVACRMAGVPVGSAGILFHARVMPGPFVDTHLFYQVREKSKRFWIPAAGPLIDLLTAGVCAWVILIGGQSLTAEYLAFFQYLFLLSIVFLYLDTNPLSPSDGSRMLEALLDDELARSSAFSKRRGGGLSSRKTIRIYRIVSMLHIQVAGVLIYCWLA